ncbi:hypothetical protein [Bordetella hinzii]|uniref:hypothetical protein n=1 Tax=Bordetella hinzii TaxID=103855 RepID=UPI000F840387|nr:hypothetical protein [Bordetella hinzii]
MKLVQILSSRLPEIDDAVKECVNQGQWLLFKAPVGEFGACRAAYFLQANSVVFALNELGGVMEQVAEDVQTPQIEELFYFSDLPQPTSLSNTSSILHVH